MKKNDVCVHSLFSRFRFVYVNINVKCVCQYNSDCWVCLVCKQELSAFISNVIILSAFPCCFLALHIYNFLFSWTGAKSWPGTVSMSSDYLWSAYYSSTSTGASKLSRRGSTWVRMLYSIMYIYDIYSIMFYIIALLTVSHAGNFHFGAVVNSRIC